MDISATPQTVASQTAMAKQAAADIDASRPALRFETFYRQKAESIARALTVTLNDSELAADATNEAMIRAYQRWAKIAGYDNPAAWVYRVGLNWSLSWKQRPRRERDRPVALTAHATEVTGRDDSMDIALGELSLEHRAVVVCRIYLDWSVEQTAQALGIATGTVKSRLSRAIAQLRTSIDPTNPAEPATEGLDR